jgi:hypothetical protein
MGIFMQRKFWFLVALVLASCFMPNVRADTAATIFETHQSLSPKDEEWTFNVAPVAAGQQVRLSLDARIDWPSLAGSNPWLRVAINGNFLIRQDLLNKRNDFKLKSGHELTWVNGDRWRILYSPDYTSAIEATDHPMSAPKDDPYHFVWDITRLVKPGTNVLKLYNLKQLPEPTTMLLRNARIEIGAPIPALNADVAEPAPTGPLTNFIVSGRKKLPFSVQVAPDGGLVLSAAGKRFPISTRTSLPGGKWQASAMAATVADAAFRSGKPLSNGQSKTVKWATPQYDVRRRVKVLDDHIHIADTLTNRSKELIGVIVENHLKYPSNPTQLRVAGRITELDEPSSVNIPENPAVFAGWPELSLGMIAEDDVFRVHIKSFNDSEGMGIADDRLGIVGGGSVTLEWSIYPVKPDTVASADYWTFVNAVRRNWGSNFTIPGPFAFPPRFTGTKPAEWYKDWVRSRGLKILAGDIPLYEDRTYGFGTGTKYATEWVAHERDWVQKLKATAPDVKTLAYFHAQASGEPGSEAKYPDSKMLGEKGEHLGINFSYPTPPYEYRVPLYLPTRENSYGKALWGYIDTCLDGMGMSGLYWDEMSYCMQPYVDHGPWDNHTVAIDPQTHAVLGKRTSLQLVMQPLQLDIVRSVRKRGKYVLANSQPMTRTMLREKIVRFTETPNYQWLNKIQFGSPVGLANRDAEPTVADTTRHIREMLAYGALYYSDIISQPNPPAWPFVSVMFPITPEEIRDGMVLGRERIQTARSGIFGWPDGARAEVYIVDAAGNRAANSLVKELAEKGRYRYEIRMPSDHFTVLVKKTTS